MQMDGTRESQYEHRRECHFFRERRQRTQTRSGNNDAKKAEQTLVEWKPISDRIIYARLFSKYEKLSIIQVYAATNEANVEYKDNFYGQLQTVVDSVHKHDILIVMGNLNAKVEEDNEGRKT